MLLPPLAAPVLGVRVLGRVWAWVSQCACPIRAANKEGRLGRRGGTIPWRRPGHRSVLANTRPPHPVRCPRPRPPRRVAALLWGRGRALLAAQTKKKGVRLRSLDSGDGPTPSWGRRTHAHFQGIWLELGKQARSTGSHLSTTLNQAGQDSAAARRSDHTTHFSCFARERGPAKKQVVRANIMRRRRCRRSNRRSRGLGASSVADA